MKRMTICNYFFYWIYRISPTTI